MRFSDLKLKTLLPIEWVVAIALAVATFIGAVIVLIPVLIIQYLLTPQLLKSSMENATLMQEAITPSSNVEFAIILFFVAIIPAVVEELFFRGLLMDAFMHQGPFWAIVNSSVAFGIIHITPLKIPSMILVGVVLGIFKYRTGKLTASIIMHLIYNGFLITLTYFASDALNADMLSFIGV
jgi:membrane protease YdiL (CAAX protease family)